MHASTPAAPWFDGDVAPASLAAAQAVTRPDLPLLAGSNRDEILLFSRMRSRSLLLRRHDIAQRLHSALGDAGAGTVLARYPDTRAGQAQLATDLNFAMPTLSLAERHAGEGGRTFVYRFDAATPWLGACHAAELPYLWDWSGPSATMFRGRMTAGRQRLADRMKRYWLGFVRDGQPNSSWPAYELPGRATMLLNTGGDRVDADPVGYRRAGWAGADVTPHA